MLLILYQNQNYFVFYVLERIYLMFYFQLLALNLDTSQLVTIPTLKSSTSSIPAECPTGIHSIAVNPSQTLLATGASNTNDLALYSIPTFDPIGTGEDGHSDWIFDIKWLDDQFIFTGRNYQNHCNNLLNVTWTF